METVITKLEHCGM